MLTVTAPADSHSLTTLEAIKRELCLSGGADDEFLAGLIDQASAAVRTWCGRAFTIEAVSETFRLKRPAESLVLTRWSVVSIDVITEVGTVLAAPDFETETDTGLLYRLSDVDGRVDWCAGKIVVGYRAGYILPGEPDRTLPDDIERAAIMLVKAAWFARTRDPLIRSEDVSGLTNTTYWVGGFGNGGSLAPDVEGLLSKHRQPPIG